MAFALVIGIVIIISLLAIAVMSKDESDIRGCNDDIPCQECGECYGNHINAIAGHAYVYPRDLHR